MDDEVNEKTNNSCCLSKSCEGCGTHNSVSPVSPPVGPGQNPVGGPGATPPEALRL